MVNRHAQYGAYGPALLVIPISTPHPNTVMLDGHNISRISWHDRGEYWDAEYVVDGTHVPLLIHKSIQEDTRYKFGSESFWEYVERSAISAWQSWLAHPEWRIN